MPLMRSKSDKAFSKNVAAEMASGKPKKQALAIAYAVKRKAHGKGYAGGGMVKPEMDVESARSIAHAIMKKRMMAMGGMVDEELMEQESHMSMDQMNYEDMGEDDFLSDDHEMMNNPETHMDAGQHMDMQPEKKQRIASIVAKARMGKMRY